MRIDPRIGEVHGDETGRRCCDLAFRGVGSKAESRDPLRHDPCVTDRGRAPLDPGGIDDLFPEDLRGRDAQGGKAAFLKRADKVLRPAEAGRLQAECARIIENDELFRWHHRHDDAFFRASKKWS